MFEYGRLPIWARWIGFIPMLAITAVAVYFVANIWLEVWFGYFSNEIVQYLLGRIAFNLIGIYFCLFASISMIPKGKIILASIYLGLIVLLIGFVGTSYIFMGPGEEYKLWQIVLEAVLTFSSGLLALLTTISWEKEQKELANTVIYTYD
ncbi:MULTISPECIES: hypothetical protein [Paenibacillus]|uniref:hypothetical protein n=1 Tax=Paenibacillus TaxID=44249 RepID=UPI00096E04B5|nr:hypothetical protein [Paenibacillus odorifer]OMD08357.1 hypothetical protein BJP50_07140 [Paenibacillus odorifer]OME06758.1 hypothetical protein BSK60_32250 [Paenibacillus odorifer]